MLAKMSNTKSELTSEDLEAMRNLQRSETRLERLKASASELNFARMEIEGQITTREAKEKDYLGLAAKYEAVIHACDTQISKL
mmetsp:Transcript_42074/g.55427  ORF Transcript_42074/g.55427 Transcript_42074/m.55427 type:complete len:83 (+) Transcript_42074:1735-1983(+)